MMNSAFLREIAVPHTALEGKVTFWMIPYRNAEVDIYISDLSRAEPYQKWVHRETGEETYDNPHPGLTDDPLLEAQRAASPWRAVDLWSTAHNVFCAVMPLTVDIEFKGKKLSADARGLQAFWQHHNGNVLHNWHLFRQLVSGTVASEWLLAYEATRDNSMDGPEELKAEPGEDADPNA